MKSPIKIWLEWYEILRSGFSVSSQLPIQDSSSINAEVDNPERLWDLSDLDTTLADTVSAPSSSEIQTNIVDIPENSLNSEEDIYESISDLSENGSEDQIQFKETAITKPKIQYASLNLNDDSEEEDASNKSEDSQEELLNVSQVKSVNLDSPSVDESSKSNESDLEDKSSKSNESDLEDIFGSADSKGSEDDIFGDDSTSGFSDVFSDDVVTKPHIKMLLEKHGAYTAKEIFNEIKEFTWNRGGK